MEPANVRRYLWDQLLAMTGQTAWKHPHAYFIVYRQEDPAKMVEASDQDKPQEREDQWVVVEETQTFQVEGPFPAMGSPWVVSLPAMPGRNIVILDSKEASPHTLGGRYGPKRWNSRWGG